MFLVRNYWSWYSVKYSHNTIQCIVVNMSVELMEETGMEQCICE